MLSKYGIYRARVPRSRWGANVRAFQGRGGRHQAASVIQALARGRGQRRNYMRTGYPSFLFRK